ncbi:MAG: thioredoxin family protein [Planctomycetes bacterium]|nr:thioredoxin family protein [Planctomycetota bacterium]
MWEAEGFAEAAGKKLIFVSLDFPRDPEIKAKVPNPERNDELKDKYGIRGFPTVLVMTPDGEVFGKTGYRPGGAEPYVKHLDEMLETGKKDLADVQKLTKALDRAEKQEDKDRAIDAIIGKLAKMNPESPFIGQLADVVSRVYPTAEGERRKACVAALVNAGRVDADLLAAAKEIDPDGSAGTWIGAVAAMAENVNSDEALEVAMTAITELFDTVKEVPADKGKFLCANMSFWSLRMKEDEAAAVKWAERGLAMVKDSEDPQDERLRSFFEDMLDE